MPGGVGSPLQERSSGKPEEGTSTQPGQEGRGREGQGAGPDRGPTCEACRLHLVLGLPSWLELLHLPRPVGACGLFMGKV